MARRPCSFRRLAPASGEPLWPIPATWEPPRPDRSRRRRPASADPRSRRVGGPSADERGCSVAGTPPDTAGRASVRRTRASAPPPSSTCRESAPAVPAATECGIGFERARTGPSDPHG